MTYPDRQIAQANGCQEQRPGCCVAMFLCLIPRFRTHPLGKKLPRRVPEFPRQHHRGHIERPSLTFRDPVDSLSWRLSFLHLDADFFPEEIFRIILSYHLHLKEGQSFRSIMALRTGEAHYASLFWPQSTVRNKQAASSQTRGTDSFPLSQGPPRDERGRKFHYAQKREQCDSASTEGFKR